MNLFKKKIKPEKKATEDNSASKEFNERISRLLLVCIEGICKLLPTKAALCENLESLGVVVRKVTRPKPISGLAKDIEDFFTRQHLEVSFLETKNDTVKQIVRDLTDTIQEITATSGSFDHKMELSIEEIQAAGNVDDILALKEGIVGEIKKVRASSQSIKKELDEYRQATQSLSSKLEQTEAKALVDALTNVLNRNAYNMKISQMVRESSRTNGVFCLLVIDIDHFKKFNDNYGHKAGDRVLRSVAASIQESLRASDLVFRYGGEEFVVLLGGANLENAIKLAEKIRKGVEKDYYIDKERKMKVTVSLGVACIHPDDTELSLFERADKALYAAKDKGRNQVVVEE